MTVTFLRAVIGGGTRVATTSNSLPTASAKAASTPTTSRREIAAIAAHFEVLRIDGPDYRAKARVEAEPFGVSELDGVLRAFAQSGATVSDRRRSTS